MAEVDDEVEVLIFVGDLAFVDDEASIIFARRNGGDDFVKHDGFPFDVVFGEAELCEQELAGKPSGSAFAGDGEGLTFKIFRFKGL